MEDGEMVQVCISMTCPKVPFSPDAVPGDGFPSGNYGEPTQYKPTEMTDGEMENVRKLIRELGL